MCESTRHLTAKPLFNTIRPVFLVFLPLVVGCRPLSCRVGFNRTYCVEIIYGALNSQTTVPQQTRVAAWRCTRFIQCVGSLTYCMFSSVSGISLAVCNAIPCSIIVCAPTTSTSGLQKYLPAVPNSIFNMPLCEEISHKLINNYQQFVVLLVRIFHNSCHADPLGRATAILVSNSVEFILFYVPRCRAGSV